MSALTVRRTLIRSTPELWAEVSDAAALARHLEHFGDIRITRLEEEEAVAWESATATGEVKLEASGLGTRVTLTAAPLAPAAPSVTAAAPAPVAPPVASPAVSAPATAAPRAVPAPMAVTPAALDIASRHSLFARRRGDRPRLLDRLRVRAKAGDVELVRADPVVQPVAPSPQPAAPAPPPAAAPSEGFDSDRATAVLTTVLDQLGSARHRPFGAA